MIGLYGGTFDPVHNGHIHAALQVQQALSLRQIRLVLAARPGHRQPPRADVEHRWQMLRLAVAEHAVLAADDSEVKRRGHSYTIDTLQEFNARQPGDVPVWIIGQDAFATLDSWHRWRELMDCCNLAVVDRPGDARAEPPSVQQMWRTHGVRRLEHGKIGQIVRLSLPMQQVSATEIRRKVACGEPFEHLLAGPVCTYIRRHGLYTTRCRTAEETVI